MSSAWDNDLVVSLRQVTYSNPTQANTSLWQGNINTGLTSLPYMWLPISLCQEFEKAFGLTWDETSQYYLVNDTHRENLISQKITISFRIGSNTSPQVVIDFPYSYFDLAIDQPYVSKKSYYFPLKRATDESQYVLGRVFLQNVYIFADYQKYTFNMSKAVHNPKVKSQIIPVTPGDGSSKAPIIIGNNHDNNSNKHKDSIGAGSIAGMVLASLAVLLAIVIFFTWRRKRQQTKTINETQRKEEETDKYLGVELSAVDNDRKEIGAFHMAPKMYEPPTMYGPPKVHDVYEVHEAPAYVAELPGKPAGYYLRDEKM
jgi:hypothetical protein